MNCHQILSGACNGGDRCFAVGSVEGIPFTVCCKITVFFFIYVYVNLYSYAGSIQRLLDCTSKKVCAFAVQILDVI
jgi:hypothetical protein